MYVKLIDNQIIQAPKNKDGIINYNLDVERMIQDGYKLFVPAEVPPETEIRMYHYEYIENENDITEIIFYDETIEQAQIRIARIKRERLDALTLTPADVERALYKEKQMDFEDLKALIVQKIPSIDIKALSIEFRAKDFYRGATANGMRLFDVVGALLGYTPDDMDYLFKNKKLPNKESEA